MSPWHLPNMETSILRHDINIIYLFNYQFYRNFQRDFWQILMKKNNLAAHLHENNNFMANSKLLRPHRKDLANPLIQTHFGKIKKRQINRLMDWS